ncbi:hypothetical protein HHK36_008425 [Tetracentron sinense]|uniref:Alpha/beta hydrolase fold-3 domain-containing protein n=1 Tax=Tetracentron sinense TaxID=13715 RepID=A0A835DJB5_TETSI|nr:hypothetical protein HHK36_008425 [Tetracentron sinense]
MDSSMSTEVAHEFLPFLRVYKDGRVERFLGTAFVPPSLLDPQTAVSSKDVVIVPETGVSARLFLPNITDPHRKLPLLVYFHGGAFCIESPFSHMYHSCLNSLVAEANVVAWIASHSKGEGPEAWLKDHADFRRVFFAGDSAGANIAHNMAMRVGASELHGVNLVGIALVHAYFVGKGGSVGKFWYFLCPSTTGSDDPRVNPAVGPSLAGLGCTRVLVCVAEKDDMRERGWFYEETLRKSGWEGDVEVMETEGEGHVFHLFNPTCEKALELMKHLSRFINVDISP